MCGVIQGTESPLVILCRIGACLFNVSVKKECSPNFPSASYLDERTADA